MIALDLSAEEATKFLKMRRGRASDHRFTDQLTVCFTLYRDTNRVIQVKQTAPAFVAPAPPRLAPPVTASMTSTLEGPDDPQAPRGAPARSVRAHPRERRSRNRTT
jgi:hypothetical protein